MSSFSVSHDRSCCLQLLVATVVVKECKEVRVVAGEGLVFWKGVSLLADKIP